MKFSADAAQKSPGIQTTLVLQARIKCRTTNQILAMIASVLKNSQPASDIKVQHFSSLRGK